MPARSILVQCGHGTYGRDDDAYGALLAANAALAKGLDVTLVLIDDGVLMAKLGQDPSGVGLPNNLDGINDLLELGGRLVVVGESLRERGLGKEDIVEGAQVLTLAQLVPLIEEHSVTLTF